MRLNKEQQQRAKLLKQKMKGFEQKTREEKDEIYLLYRECLDFYVEEQNRSRIISTLKNIEGVL
jgi:hypothetical protein